MKTTKVLFVCLGNICRSPLAEAVMRHRIAEEGLDWIEVDSAGTGDWHIGRAPDARAQRLAQQRGYDLQALRARQVQPEDALQFDYIFAMDSNNLADLEQLSQLHSEPVTQPRLFLHEVPSCQEIEVPDPYYESDAMFDTVLDLIELGVDYWLPVLRLAGPPQ